jgi:hypothetical protein
VSFWLTESVLSRMNLLMDKFQIPSCRGWKFLKSDARD